MTISASLATVREAPFVVDVLRAAEDLAAAAGRDGGPRVVQALTEVIHDPTDELAAIAAVHAVGRVFDDSADAVLSDLLSSDRAFLREHAAWTLCGRLPRLDAVGRLVAVVTAGGFPGMLAQRTLESWSRSASDHVALALEGAVAGPCDHPTRARLVETLGLVPGDLARRAVLRIAADPLEDDTVRATAVASLGDHEVTGEVAALLAGLAAGDGDGELVAVARLAELDLGLRRTTVAPVARGTVIAQLFLHADIDRDLSRVGAGDNGGVATLLLRLGDALTEEESVGRVLTMSRGTAEASAAALLGTGVTPRHVLAPIPLLSPAVGAVQAWPTRITAQRAIRRVLRAYGPVDAVHLRMGDVGSMAADAVARDLGIPVVFTLAPDPHALIHSLDMTGALTRHTFGRSDEREHYWFRARLVERIAANASHNVLFPRPDLDHDLHDLFGIDRAEDAGRYTVVPEGIDLSVTSAAARDVTAAEPVPAVADLDALIAALPAHRHGLPIALSVGRLHRVKGMATVVEAWAADPRLREGVNLLLVGGELDAPSADEAEQVRLIRSVVAAHPGAADGLVLAGHRPHDVAARWMAAAHLGVPPRIAPGGAYVSGSLKEEFGLAIVEALAAGLPVVAPNGGGPATYVQEGVTGLLVDTRDPRAVGAGLLAALALAGGPGSVGRALGAHAFVRDHFTVQSMARALAGVYDRVRTRASSRPA